MLRLTRPAVIAGSSVIEKTSSRPASAPLMSRSSSVGSAKRVRDAEVAQRWPERTHNHFSTAVTSFGNEAANHHVLISANKTSS